MLSVGLLLASQAILTHGTSTPEEAGLQIAIDAYERSRGFENFSATMQMVLRNKRGQTSQRLMRVRVLEGVGADGDRSMFVFEEPRDVRGTAFLVHSFKDRADDQWLFLPALDRTKRISSSGRSSSFMGSEFSYEDLGVRQVEDFTYKFLGEESCGDLTCSMVEAVPVDKKSGYRRQVVWQDRDALRTWKIEFYDRKDSHLKTLTNSGFEQYLDKYWHPHHQLMENHLTGKSTVLKSSNFKFGEEVDASNFTSTGLRRQR